MKLVKLILMAILFGGILSVVGVPTKPHIVGEDANYGQNDIKTACINFNELNNKIRDNIISKNEAQKLFTSHILAVKNLFLVGVPTNPNIVGEDTNHGQSLISDSNYFPLQGYNYLAVGGKNGNGYKPNKYSYFDGNKHQGHPANDIFINDKNQDCFDDKTFNTVNILSMSFGIVIALKNDWDSTSKLRGGKYLYIYNPNRGQIFYYAHCQNISVSIGDIVKAGQVIGTVGRTGLNAFKKRSPTHLHLMLLMLDNNYFPKPSNTYNLLVKSKK